MGYTRYWVRPKELDPEKFALFSVSCRDACKDLADCMTNAVFTDAVVSFEGKPSCEPFVVERISTGRQRGNGISEYCKTQHLPYDEAVARCIDILKKNFPEVEVPEPS